MQSEFDGIVGIVWLRLLCPGIRVLRIFEANVSVERGELTVLGMLKVIQDSGRIISLTLVKGRFVTIRVSLSFVTELQQHVALHLSQLEALEEEMDAIATQRVAKPGRPIVLGPQKLPHVSRQGIERCRLHQCVPVGSIHLIPRLILAVKQPVVKEVPRIVPRLLDNVP